MVKMIVIGGSVTRRRPLDGVHIALSAPPGMTVRPDCPDFLPGSMSGPFMGSIDFVSPVPSGPQFKLPATAPAVGSGADEEGGNGESPPLPTRVSGGGGSKKGLGPRPSAGVPGTGAGLGRKQSLSAMR
eukprot:gene9529-8520_t